jgi:hypothetical protein
MEKPTTTKDLRWFGVMMCAALCVFAAIAWYKGSPRAAAGLCGAGALFLSLGLAVPAALGPIYRPWMKLAAALGWVNTRVLLGLMFFLAFTPIALARRILGHDPLGLRFDEKSHAVPTYWKKKTPPDDIRKYFERQS